MLMLQALIGVLIGDGVGLGVELVELPTALAERRAAVGDGTGG
jgi:hypothetical protein